MDAKFRDPEKNPLLNEVDWMNLFYDFKKIFEGVKGVKIKSQTEACFLDPNNLDSQDENNPTFVLQENNMVKVLKGNKFNISKGDVVTKFMIFSAIKFNNDYFAAMNFIAYNIRKKQIPYIRVACDYFKVIEKEDRYGGVNKTLKQWSKDEIKEDHSKSILKLVYKYDDFTIVPDNINYSPAYLNCYNLYSAFAHKPFEEEVTESDIPNTIILLKHIFLEHFEIGLKYLKILYEDPKQILPVLVLVSTERETGKTTFLNWIHMIFGENSVLISPQELTSNFNSGYATKNIIMVDETVIEKSTSVERLKSLATAKYLSVSEKHVSSYSVPFFGKIIICTNKEKDFMRIDEEEIRFWIRKINMIEGVKNVNIEKDLFVEIPKFLKYLHQLSEVDKSKSRMVFTMDEISTENLKEVKDESKSGLRKEIEILIDDWFMNNDNITEIELTAKDIKEEWFGHNHSIPISYIRKVVKYEMKLTSGEVKKYHPFNRQDAPGKLGRPFVFKRSDIDSNNKIFISDVPVAQEELPF